MKVYLVAHKDYALSPVNMCAWAETEQIGTNGIYVKSVQAFLRKRNAADYLSKLPNDVAKYCEIVHFFAQDRARTRPWAKNAVSTRRNKKDALKRVRTRKKHVRNMDGGCSCGAPSEVSCAEWKAAT